MVFKTGKSLIFHAIMVFRKEEQKNTFKGASRDLLATGCKGKYLLIIYALLLLLLLRKELQKSVL